jgi:hypothetical protein
MHLSSAWHGLWIVPVLAVSLSAAAAEHADDALITAGAQWLI